MPRPRQEAPDGYKVCSKCKQTKLTADFQKHARAWDGLQSRCRRCHLKDPDRADDVAQHRQMGLKRCSKCQEVSPLSCFHKDATGLDGHSSQCKGCYRLWWEGRRRDNLDAMRLRERQYYAGRAGEIQERRREIYASLSHEERERRLALRRQYRSQYWRRHKREIIGRRMARRASYLQEALAYERKYRRNNPEKFQVANRKWASNNRGKLLDGTHRRRARLARCSGSHSFIEWEKLKKYHNYRCLRCGRREPHIKLARDHVIPVIKGGSNSIDNIQPLCISCNASKGATATDYR